MAVHDWDTSGEWCGRRVRSSQRDGRHSGRLVSAAGTTVGRGMASLLTRSAIEQFEVSAPLPANVAGYLIERLTEVVSFSFKKEFADK